MKQMESFVNCPECGELVRVVMKAYDEALVGLLGSLEKSFGMGKTDHFDGEGKCQCGKRITATLHVTCVGEGSR